MAVDKKHVFALHRYFIWADRMREHFDSIIAEKEKYTESRFEIETFLYMSCWYGLFYVVIEGWMELSLTDSKIDALLESKNVNYLKRYRNGTFHFQKIYADDRFSEFMISPDNPVKWIRELRGEFSRYFLDYFKCERKTK